MIAPAGRKLGKFEILRKLGRGGMADVYLAMDTATRYEVALKLIEHAPDSDTVDSIEAERRGAWLQARLAEADPHVTRVYDAGDVDGYFYIAMEYIDGEDLATLIRRGPLAPDHAVDIALAVARTLDAAHNLDMVVEGKNYHGVVHGDIKPKNIRINGRGEARVLDFGIAKALSLSRRLTRNEFGSVPYSSPERLDDGTVDFHSDLWSLAVMLYEMITGTQPYHAETTERLEKMIRSRVPPPPPPDPCPDALRRILAKAMLPDPEGRYQSAREFAEDLARFRSGAPVLAVSEDLDATRRTSRRPEADDTRRTTSRDGDETRRTTERAPEPAVDWPAGDAAQPQQQSAAGRYMAKAVIAVLCLGLGWSLWAGFSTWLLSRRAQAFERAIQTESITDPDVIYKRWRELSGDNPSSFVLRGPRKLVKQKLVEAADRVIASYRNSDAVYENTWKGARDELVRALALDPDDAVRGKLRLAEGHLARIDGTAHRNTAELNQAVDKFNEAQRLLPNSPDPALGLARVYVYGLHDIDRAFQALQDAEKRGHPLGNREKAQLADGYRDRANRLFWDSRNVRGLPQEKDQIERAKADYERAVELYQGIQPYGNSTEAIQDIDSSLESVNNRLREIDGQGVGKAVSGALEKLLHIWR